MNEYAHIKGRCKLPGCCLTLSVLAVVGAELGSSSSLRMARQKFLDIQIGERVFVCVADLIPDTAEVNI